ncbi:hypothetical protein [Tenacibaculum xiamenense]|uniref:hypothetical protein n=1 Tax=Tenacibaculum xiamenense TaxID=1261553 RepID=UPI00389319F3
MSTKPILNNKTFIVVCLFLLTLTFILIEYFKGGVITHHLLAREDLPGISNWWGLLTVPVLGLLSVHFIDKRRNKLIKSEAININYFDSKILRSFLFALLFGSIASLLWEFGQAEILQYYILLPILIAFFKPVHFTEYLLGFVVGMLYTFGGILPILIGTVSLIICFIMHKLINLIIGLFTKAK